MTTITTTTTALTEKNSFLTLRGFLTNGDIGSGNYAKVKKAYSSEHKTVVAIKIITKSNTPPEYIKKFLPRELNVVKGLKHENIIKFLQSIETTKRVFIIMEYAENGSLLHYIKMNHFLHESEAKQFFHQLLSAIEYCHKKGIVHRDIKCENLLLDSKNTLKLIDFGFARNSMLNNGKLFKMSETFCGSYAYASPEILKGTPYQPQYSDIWASGVVLYSMVYGHLPFDNSSLNKLLKATQSFLNFPKRPQISEFCQDLIMNILAPLENRYYIDKIKESHWFSTTEKRFNRSSEKNFAVK